MAQSKESSSVRRDSPADESRGSDQHARARDRIRVLLEREQEKEAYKEAKTLFRVDTSAATRGLLERCYVARIAALVRSGMPSAAKELAELFLEFGVTDTRLLPQLLPLLLNLGLAHRAAPLAGSLPSTDVRRQVDEAVYDQAIARPTAADSLPEAIRTQSQLVRQALEAVAAGDDARAGELLQGIPRQSEYAEWKLFIRGLIAHYRGDAEQVANNWQRLTPGRLPGRMATTLSKMNGSAAASSADISRWESKVLGCPVSSHLDGIQRAVDEEDARSLLKAIRSASAAIARLGPAFSARLTAVVLPLARPLLESAGPREGDQLVEELTRSATPLPFDPHWHRFRALFYEGVGLVWPRAVAHWERYLDELPSGEAAGAKQAALRRAIVCEHVAQRLFEFSVYNGAHLLNEVELRTRTEQWYQRATAACPQLRSAWHGWRQSALSWGDERLAQELIQRTYQALPDDVESIERLYLAARSVGKKDEAAKWLAAAQALEPLNARYRRWSWAERLAAARELSTAGQADKVREALAAARLAAPGVIEQAFSVACEAAVAFRVKDVDAAEAAVESIGKRVDPLIGGVALSFAAQFFQLSRALTKRFDTALGKACKKRKTVASLKALCDAVEVVAELRPPDSEAWEYERHAASFLDKCHRLKLSEEEMERVVRCAGDWLRNKFAAAEWAVYGLQINPFSTFFVWQFGRSALAINATDEEAPNDSGMTGVQALLLAAQLARKNPSCQQLLPEILCDLRGADPDEVMAALEDLEQGF